MYLLLDHRIWRVCGGLLRNQQAFASQFYGSQTSESQIGSFAHHFSAVCPNHRRNLCQDKPRNCEACCVCSHEAVGITDRCMQWKSVLGISSSHASQTLIGSSGPNAQGLYSHPSSCVMWSAPKFTGPTNSIADFISMFKPNRSALTRVNGSFQKSVDIFS